MVVMRIQLFAVTTLLVACASPDPLVNAYNATVTGTDMQTAPSSSSNSVSGTGTVTIHPTHADPNKYILTFGQSTYQCTLSGTRNMMDPLTIDIAGAQQCHIDFNGGNLTATTTAGTAKIDKEKMETITLNVSYSYAGSVTIGIFTTNYAGTGARTFTGPRL